MTALFVLSIVLRSAAFGDGQPIPKLYTCDGGDKSPPLELGEMPAGAQSWAVIVDDPDAPGGTFVHWVIWDLPKLIRTLPPDAPKEQLQLADRSHQGKNDFGKVGYGGPCPPPGKPHH